MTWQDVGVILIVSGAAYYLVRKLFGSPRPKRTGTTFVPLTSLKKPRKEP